MAGADLVTLDDVRAAAAKLVAGRAAVTPVRRSENLGELCRRPVLLKCEQLQRTGSFKFRGAFHHVTSLDPSVTTVVAASAGNHAQGVALAARSAGRRAVIFMPGDASLPKVEATRSYGAEVRLGGASVDDALARAAAFATEAGAHVVPPFDDPLVIAGQGTVGLELADELAADVPAAVVVPVGGGGLLAGVAAALRGLGGAWSRTRIVGVEPEGAAAMRASLSAGHPVRLEGAHTIADGLAVKAPSARTLAHAEALVDEIVTVSDEEIARALVLLFERAKAVVEPAGAAALAALLAGKVEGAGTAVAVLSGGNVDPLVLTRLVEHGLSSSGRFLRLRLVVDDRPGALAAVTNAVASLGLNVLGVEHHRAGVRLGVDEVEVLLTLETRDAAHAAAAVDALRATTRAVEVL